MVWYILIGALAAFGLVCAVWAVCCWRIPGGRGWIAVCMGGQAPAAARRCCWLREWGLLRGPVLVVEEDIPDETRRLLEHRLHGIEFCSLEALPGRLKLERKRIGRTGIGDHPGRDPRGGVSEL